MAKEAKLQTDQLLKEPSYEKLHKDRSKLSARRRATFDIKHIEERTLLRRHSEWLLKMPAKPSSKRAHEELRRTQSS